MKLSVGQVTQAARSSAASPLRPVMSHVQRVRHQSGLVGPHRAQERLDAVTGPCRGVRLRSDQHLREFPRVLRTLLSARELAPVVGEYGRWTARPGGAASGAAYGYGPERPRWAPMVWSMCWQ